MESCGTASPPQAQMEISRILSLAAPGVLVLLGPGQVPLGPGIGAIVVVSPVCLDVSALLGYKSSLGGIRVPVSQGSSWEF